MSSHRKKPSPKRLGVRHYFVLLVFATAAVARVYFAFHTEMYVVPDEYAHWNYAKYIRAEGKLPDFAEPHAMNRNTPERHSYENYQQPGYYMLAAVLSFGSPWGARLVSIAIFMIGLVFLYRVFPNPWVIGVFALLPGTVFVSSIVSNDGLIFTAVCLLVWALKSNNKPGFAVSVFLLGISKFHGLVILAVLLVYLLVFRREGKAWIWVLLALGIGGLAWINRYPLSKINSSAWQGVSPEVLFRMVKETAYSFFVSPETKGAADWQYAVTLLVGAVVLSLALYSLYRHPLTPYAFVAYAGIFVFLAFTFTHVHYQGRLLYPVVPALLANWRPRQTGAREKSPVKNGKR